MPEYDVVVIGGGPAGSSAARTLALSGLSVCVIDKKEFPRNKLCGGLLTLRSKKVFDSVFNVSWDNVIEKTSRGVEFYYNTAFLNSVSNYKDVYFTSRRNFDNFLLSLSKKTGAKLLLGQGVKYIDEKDKKLVLDNGEQIKYKYLIGSDGVNSVVARFLFGSPFDKKTIAFGVEIEVPYSTRVESIENPEIYFGVVNWGYGWVFPKKDTLTVGLGALHEKNKDIKSKFDKFLVMRFGYVPEAKIKGHYIPFGDYKRVPGRKCILLAGDAAGLVEPITGEGIAFAMQSGFFAAESILEATKKRTDDVLSIYTSKYKRITNILDYANILKYLLFQRPLQHLFKVILPQTTSVIRNHMDLMADECSYQNYSKFLFKEALRRVYNH